MIFFRAAASEEAASDELPGWALNISRGGLRAIIEDRVQIGDEFEIQIGDEPTLRQGQIVWTQDEPDGTIVGVSFRERLEEAPPGVELDASVEIAAGDVAKALGVSEDELADVLSGKNPADPSGTSGR